MSKRSDQDFIEDILICLSKIEEYIYGLTYDDFVNDHKTQDAIIRNLEIIGEASKQISSGLKEKYQNIPWKMIAGTRDRLIHGYFGVNIDIVWEVATIDAPSLKQEIEKIKKEWCGYRDRDAPHRAPLPHHAAYGSVLRGSADQAGSDPGKQRPK